MGVIVVEVTVELCIGRDLGIDAALPEEVEGDFGLRQDIAPCVEGERRIDGRKAGDEVIFEGADLLFGGVPAMDGRRCELEGNVVVGDEVAKGGRCLIVEILKFWF